MSTLTLSAVGVDLMTVDRFRELDDPPGAYYELRSGEVVEVSRPKWEHSRVQSALRDRLNSRAEGAGRAESEFAFRALPEYELRAADVAYIGAHRYRAMADDDNLRGSPDLVVEVLSPSNTQRELREKGALCLNTGSVEFWIVDPDRETVTVYTSGDRIDYDSSQALPVERFLPGKSPIAVGDLFSDPLA